MTKASEFRSIEIDALDDRLAETARRKRIPTLKIETGVTGTDAKGEERGGGSEAVWLADVIPDGPSAPEPTRRPDRRDVRRRPLSLEVPDYLARELKVKAATESVTVRYLVLTALAAAGYRVDADELEEDGRRLR